MIKKILFTKMVGAGNDFIILEAKKGLNYKRLADKMCDRANGLGADGLLILDKSTKCDYRMRIINADGSEAEMCGNGARCLAAYITKHKEPKKKLFSMQTIAGTILGEAKGEIANIRLSEPKNFTPNVKLTINKRKLCVQYIDTGVPHAIIFVDGLKKIDVQTIGRAIRFHKKFKPRGTNVNFVEFAKTSLVNVRTYERGVEDETKACGTGSVASAILSYLQLNENAENKTGARMKVKTRNGDILDITFDIKNKKPTNVWLKGPAKFVAEGTYFINK